MRLYELAEPADTFLMWHGSRRWDGRPEIRAPREGRYEAGPGIYLTNRYMTAAKYAKGGGSTMLVAIDRHLRMAWDVDVPLADAIAFVKATRMGHKKEIIADLQANASRKNQDTVKAAVLINLTVNYRAGSGNAGLALARFLREHGVDASLEDQSGSEQWLVVINPQIIRSIKPVRASDVTMDMRDLPPVR
jgi:hypothetical protein